MTLIPILPLLVLRLREEQKVKAGFKTYTGPTKGIAGRPKIKPFRIHVGIDDLKFKELMRWWRETNMSTVKHYEISRL